MGGKSTKKTQNTTGLMNTENHLVEKIALGQVMGPEFRMLEKYIIRKRVFTKDEAKELEKRLLRMLPKIIAYRVMEAINQGTWADVDRALKDAHTAFSAKHDQKEKTKHEHHHIVELRLPAENAQEA